MKPDVLKPDVLKPDVLKPDVLWVYLQKYLYLKSFLLKRDAEIAPVLSPFSIPMLFSWDVQALIINLNLTHIEPK